jgi:hypothetical protein
MKRPVGCRPKWRYAPDFGGQFGYAAPVLQGNKQTNPLARRSDLPGGIALIAQAESDTALPIFGDASK